MYLIFFDGEEIQALGVGCFGLIQSDLNSQTMVILQIPLN